jgi:gamma-butyrobetaine dioxygenase
VPDPINVAYSTLGLVMHQDLVYYESPPGLQLLHCMRFDDEIKV